MKHSSHSNGKLQPKSQIIISLIALAFKTKQVYCFACTEAEMFW